MVAASAPGLRLYSYGACSTCRRALKWLADHSISFEVIDITLQPPAEAELRAALKQLGRGRLFNTSGLSYRALGGATIKAYSDDQAIVALAADGKLIKRPFLVTPEGAVLTGFQPAEWIELLIPGA